MWKNAWYVRMRCFMDISRQTFDRIIENAHRKVAQALVQGQALEIKGGEVKMTERKILCCDCQHKWEVPYVTGKPQECPSCKSINVHRVPEDLGPGRKSRRGQGANKRERNNCLGKLWCRLQCFSPVFF